MNILNKINPELLVFTAAYLVVTAIIFFSTDIGLLASAVLGLVLIIASVVGKFFLLAFV